MLGLLVPLGTTQIVPRVYVRAPQKITRPSVFIPGHINLLSLDGISCLISGLFVILEIRTAPLWRDFVGRLG